MTLSYEMCVKLKEAGFPQVFVQNKPKGSATIETFGPYDPTLEELIEACGDERIELVRPVLGLWEVQTKDWKASGSTPSEAFAELYIKRNKQ